MNHIVTWKNGISQNYDRFQLPDKKKTNSNLTKCLLKYFCYAACGALVIYILIIIIIALFFVKNRGGGNDFKNDNLKNDFHGKIFFLVDYTKVMQLDPKTNDLTREFEVPVNEDIRSYEICTSTNISCHSYWIGTFANGIPFVAQKDDTIDVLLQDSRFTPNSLTFDRDFNNLYMTDGKAGTVVVLNILTGYYAILLTDLIDARQVVIDPEEGLMFILQYSHSIVRANMAGFQPTDIVTNVPIIALTLDSTHKRLYWIDTSIGIESSNYDGVERRLIFKHANIIMGLTFADNFLFWSQPHGESNVNFYSCRINLNDSCAETVSHEVSVPGSITSIRSYPELASSASNPCHMKNGGCKHLCLPSKRNKSVCACRMGWELDPDQRGCHEVRDFVLYVHGNVVRTCDLNGTRELFWPTSYMVEKLHVKTEIDFDYDLKNDYFYFSDDHHIHRMKLKSYAGQEVVLSTNSTDTIIEDIAYDWFTGNMYFGRHHINTNHEHFLALFNTQLGQAYIKTVNVTTGDIKPRKHSYALMLHGTERFLFTSIIHNRNEPVAITEVLRISINGSDVENVFHGIGYDELHHRFFTVDNTNNLFYKLSSFKKQTTSVDWSSVEDGSGVGSCKSIDVIRARTIDVHQQSLYLSNSSSIYRFNLKIGTNAVKIAPRIEDAKKKVVAVKIISEDVQLTGSNNPCAKDNGGCEQFCFAGKKATCGCKDGQTVENDGHCH